jgi:hypothetical protein
MELVAETTTLADQSGVGAENLYSLFETFFPAPSILQYSRKVRFEAVWFECRRGRQTERGRERWRLMIGRVVFLLSLGTMRRSRGSM